MPEKGPAETLAGWRTEHAIQRTRFAADRTIMAILRTSLSMIGFGFTIFSFFRVLAETDRLAGRLPDRAPALFGLALVLLGVFHLSVGIVADIRYMRVLRGERERLMADGLLPEAAPMPRSLALLTAILLLLVGLAAIFAILLRL